MNSIPPSAQRRSLGADGTANTWGEGPKLPLKRNGERDGVISERDDHGHFSNDVWIACRELLLCSSITKKDSIHHVSARIL